MLTFFSEEGEQLVIAAIQEMECRTSGEVRVHIQEHCQGNILDDAARVFRNLKMHETKERNGVLIYIVPERHEFAVIGDKGINERVPEDYWQDVRDIIQAHFKAGTFAEGVATAVERIGEKLAVHFPATNDGQNQLPDDISYG